MLSFKRSISSQAFVGVALDVLAFTNDSLRVMLTLRRAVILKCVQECLHTYESNCQVFLKLCSDEHSIEQHHLDSGLGPSLIGMQKML